MSEQEYIEALVKELEEGTDESGVWDYPTFIVTAEAMAKGRFPDWKNLAANALDTYLNSGDDENGA